MKKRFLILLLLLVYNVPQAVYADNLNSLLSINLNGGVGFPWGKLMSEEEDAVTMYVDYSDGSRKEGSPEHMTYNYGFSIDVLPFDPSLSSSLTSATRLGFRFKYNWNIVNQDISIGGGNYEEKSWSEKLMTFNSVLGGVVFYYAPSLVSDVNDPSGKKYSSNYLISVYALFGKVLNGEITPYPIAQNEILGTSVKSDFSGYKMEVGIGFEYSGGSSFQLGGNLFYGYTAFKTDKEFYDAGTDLNYSEVSLEIYAGLSI
jgi:hypothetical protein